MVPYEQTSRLFVAVELDESVRRRLVRVQRSLASRCPDVRWTHEDALHLTLRFIGEAPVRDIEPIAEAVDKEAARSEACDLNIAGLGCFPVEGRVRIVWAGATESSGTLADLVRRMDEALTRLGYPSDGKPFRPHITLGRVKEDRSHGELRRTVQSAALDAMMQDVGELVLMASDLSSRGPRYSVVSHHSLGVS